MISMQAKKPVNTSPTQSLIKRLREEHHLSQSEIARRTHIPQPRISRWENGEVSAGADDALRLQDLLTELKAGASKRASKPKRTTAKHEHPLGAGPR